VGELAGYFRAGARTSNPSTAGRITPSSSGQSPVMIATLLVPSPMNTPGIKGRMNIMMVMAGSKDPRSGSHSRPSLSNSAAAIQDPAPAITGHAGMMAAYGRRSDITSRKSTVSAGPTKMVRASSLSHRGTAAISRADRSDRSGRNTHLKTCPYRLPHFTCTGAAGKMGEKFLFMGTGHYSYYPAHSS